MSAHAPPAHLSQAGALLAEGRFEEARTLLLRQTQQKNPHPHTFYLLAIAADALAQPDQALYSLQRAAGLAPHDPMLAAALAHAHSNRGKLAEGAAILEAWCTSHPPDPGALATLASALTELERDEDAMKVIERVHAAIPQSRSHPDLTTAHAALLHKLGRGDEAIAEFRRAGRVLRAASLLLNLGRESEALEAFKDATVRYPDDEAAWTHYAFALNYLDAIPAAEQLRAHTEYARAVRKRLGPPFAAWNVTPDPDRPLRIAIISPDLKRHAIVSFLAPLLESYDHSQWRITAFFTGRKRDDVTARLRTLVDDWRDVPNTHPRFLAEAIRRERIDVAIELSGHTELNVLPAMHLRPAPVGVTYLGYPNTTGLDTIALRIVDSITDPPGTEMLSIERLARIDPCFLCFKPIVDAPETAPRAATGPVAFGSFNLPIKISPSTLALWGRVLSRTPGSTLVLKHAALTQPWMRDLLAKRLAAAGIDQSRVRVLPPAPAYRDHLAAYEQVDIALDTFPYHGTTTTCEALWMGVPVVSLIGDRHASRVGASLLGAVGLSDLAAASEDEFLRIAATLAADPARLRAWRTPGPESLRSSMSASPLCDAQAFVSRFQAAIRQAWRDWCTSRK